MIRQITPRELADLSERWNNSKIDDRKYYQCVLEAWEVDEDTYQKCKADGVLCQKQDDRYYIA